MKKFPRALVSKASTLRRASGGASKNQQALQNPPRLVSCPSTGEEAGSPKLSVLYAAGPD